VIESILTDIAENILIWSVYRIKY